MSRFCNVSLSQIRITESFIGLYFGTLAGLARSTGRTDGTGSAARFYSPSGVAVDAAGNVFVADNSNSNIRKVTSMGVVTTLAGSTTGAVGHVNGTGSAARFYSPSGVAVDAAGNVFVGDGPDYTIRKVTSAGVVTTLAGTTGFNGSTDGTGTGAKFGYPYGVAIDAAGNIFVADTFNYTIRKVTSVGVVTTLAGNALSAGSIDGQGGNAKFRYPYGVAVDSTGNVFVADTGNATIRKVTSAGVVSTLAGTAGVTGTADATGSSARFNLPVGLAVDAAGNVLVADQSGNTIRKVTSAGVVTTIAGTPGVRGSTDGDIAKFYGPTGIAINSAGNVFVSDNGNSTIRISAAIY
jgi:DNA-binding beta-propeller fold protein YncE